MIDAGQEPSKQEAGLMLCAFHSPQKQTHKHTNDTIKLFGQYIIECQNFTLSIMRMSPARDAYSLRFLTLKKRHGTYMVSLMRYSKQCTAIMNLNVQGRVNKYYQGVQ